jgi:hypothetical protein
MRKIEIRDLEGIKVIYADAEYTGLNYTKDELNAMLDDLVDTGLLSKPRSRSDLLTELLTRTLDRCDLDHALEEGPLTPEEIREVTRIVAKSIKKGWLG